MTRAIHFIPALLFIALVAVNFARAPAHIATAVSTERVTQW